MSETFKSTDDARVANSPVRHIPRTLNDAEACRVSAVKDIGDAFLTEISCEQGREFALARTKIEEAVMWAVKGLTR
ncbi:hypothetical protein KZZ08_17210 [Roseovarius mucosus]|uniref:Acb2/Tad1 hairpin domain-containing protein n=1 Tax=Roseovarius mucosus TaxID=215743 RepID=A0A1V0RT52_9RHOB|nr:hypothetical protein [Roseovarius mucosus]ARE84948.1 hypothetical protein ROSMUCSMR3_03494 [Roseovarius mucosus]MBW4975372.1 hypothetical protein [Roseovarius mucosus]